MNLDYTYIKIITVDWHRDVASQWVQETCANCIIAPSTTHQWDKYKSLLHMRCMYVIVCIYLREKYLIILLLCGILFHLMIFDASPRTWVWCITSVAKNFVFNWDRNIHFLVNVHSLSFMSIYFKWSFLRRYDNSLWFIITDITPYDKY